MATGLKSSSLVTACCLLLAPAFVSTSLLHRGGNMGTLRAADPDGSARTDALSESLLSLGMPSSGKLRRAGLVRTVVSE
jgi:hypothetical protein